MWTSSCQKMSYMCVTAHFIDNNWRLHKKILNFCQVSSHTGETICATMDKCLNNWGLHRVLSLTVDNASSNDVGVRRLKKRLLSRGSLVMNGNYFHMRCCAHVLNLIVKDGLEDMDESVLRIRQAVWYVRSSPLRLSKFKGLIDEQSVGGKSSVCLDVETRWNTTYLMVAAALKHEKTFEELCFLDQKYVNELTTKGKGVPTQDDWKRVREILPFLKMFYDATVRISGSSYLTSNIYMFEILGIGKRIVEMCSSEDVHLRSMAQTMKLKYDKYWGNYKSLNMMLLVALVFDPRRKEKSTALQEYGQEDSIGTVNTASIPNNAVLFSNSPELQQSGLPPLVSALKASAEENAASFHFPGHNRGHAAPSSLTQLIGTRPYAHDLSSIPELDNLFCPQGPILEAQREASKLFGSSETWFLVNGTTCGVQAAIMATCSPGGYLILPRNSHLSAISAMVLSGAVPKYIIPDYKNDWDIAGGVTPLQVLNAIQELELEGKKAAAVFITSPTYHGVCSNLSDISALCHSRKIPLIVDEAHGAHLGLHPELPSSALQQGADLTVQSTHKVLSSLTQSSMLHMSGDIVEKEKISRCLQTLQSTSPSYLLLASLDAARAQLSESPAIVFKQAIELANEAKFLLKRIPGVSVLENASFPNFPAFDPFRLTVGFWELGLSGYQANEILCRDFGIIRELVGYKSITYVLNLGTCRDHVQRLLSGAKHLAAVYSSIQQRKDRVLTDHAPFDDIIMNLTPRDAFFASKRKVTVKESIGKVSGELICPYPPGIPVLIPGEVITEKAVDYLLHVRSEGADISGASDPLLSSIVVCNV